MTNERKEYILKLINLNTKLDTLRTNISLITYNITQHDEIEIKNIDFDDLNKCVDSIFEKINEKKGVKDESKKNNK